MPRPCSIPLDDLRGLVAAGGGTWRHTSLCATLVRLHRCHERTARRIIRDALAAGFLTNEGGWYRVADGVTNSRLPSRSRGSTPARAVASPSFIARPQRVDRLRMLQLLQGRTSRYSDVISTLCCEFGCCQSTARANLKHALTYGYIERVPDGYRLSPEGIQGLESFGRLDGTEGVTFARFCAGRPGLARDTRR
jgi:hypothetical protein